MQSVFNEPLATQLKLFESFRTVNHMRQRWSENVLFLTYSPTVSRQVFTFLYSTQLPHTLEIDDANGRKMSAMTVFAECIRYMKSHLMKELDRQGTLVNDGDIHWVLTVPAIWSDSAKQFMRKAAQNVSTHHDWVGEFISTASQHCTG